MKKILVLLFLMLGGLMVPIQAANATMLDRGIDSLRNTLFGETIVGGALLNGLQFAANVATSVWNSAGCHISESVCFQQATDFEARLASYTNGSCWFCGVLGDIFDIMNDIVTMMCHDMRGQFLTLLGLGMLFWLLFRVGKVVINMTPEADSGFLPDVIKQILRVIVASLCLWFYADIFNYIVSPMLEFSIGLGNEITGKELTGYVLSAKRTGESSVEMAQSDLCPQLEEAKRNEALEKRNSHGSSTDGSKTDENKKVYSEVTKESFLCYVRFGSAAMMTGMAVGSTAIHAWGDMSLVSKLTHMQLPMIGLEIFLAFFCLFLMFPMKLFDPLVNLAFVSAMFPLWVVLWAFPFGKEYFKKALDMFASVIVHLIVISIMSVIVINVMDSALGSEQERELMYQKLKDGANVADIFEGVGKTGWSVALGGFGLVGKATLMTFALGFFAAKLFGKTKDIANGFKGGINFQANEAATELAGSAEKGLANTGASLVSAGWHAMAPEAGDVLASTKSSNRLSKFTRTAMMVSGNPLLMAAGLRRFADQPTSTSNTIGGALNASWLGRRFNWLKRSSKVDFEKDRATKAKYWLNQKTGIGVRQNKDGSVVKHNFKTNEYTEIDKKGAVSTFNVNTGEMKIGDSSYKIDNVTGALTFADGKAVQDAKVEAQARALKARAENNETGWLDFANRFEKRGWKINEYSES